MFGVLPKLSVETISTKTQLSDVFRLLCPEKTD